MAIEQSPVTFHLRADALDPVASRRRRRARPYRAVLAPVLVFSALGLACAHVLGAFAPSPPPRLASPPLAAGPSFAAAPALGNAPPAATPAPVRADLSPDGVDAAPVGSITRSAKPASAFLPLERSPAYTGFAVTAGR